MLKKIKKRSEHKVNPSRFSPCSVSDAFLPCSFRYALRGDAGIGSGPTLGKDRRGSSTKPCRDSRSRIDHHCLWRRGREGQGLQVENAYEPRGLHNQRNKLENHGIPPLLTNHNRYQFLAMVSAQQIDYHINLLPNANASTRKY